MSKCRSRLPLVCFMLAACSSSGHSTSNAGGAAGNGVGGGVTTGGSSATGGSGTSGGSGGTGGVKPSGGSGGSGGSAGAAVTRPKLGDKNADGLTLVWADEFDGPAIDRTVWGNELGMLRNQEEQTYTNKDANQFIENGELVIRGIHDTSNPPANYTSASLITKGTKSFKYGLIEARAKVPAAKGSWPAFWLLPQDHVYGGWPLSGEIDVMEVVSQDPNTVYGTAHFEQNNAPAQNGGTTHLSAPVSADYHVFAVLWTSTALKWRVDGAEYHTFDISQPIDGRTPFAESFYILLNYAIGGTWPEAPDPAQYPDEYRIDWIRVWQ